MTPPGEILISALAAYAIVRDWDRRLFRWSFFYLLAAMFIPFPVVALPQFQLTSMLGLDNPLGVAILRADHFRCRRQCSINSTTHAGSRDGRSAGALEWSSRPALPWTR